MHVLRTAGELNRRELNEAPGHFHLLRVAHMLLHFHLSCRWMQIRRSLSVTLLGPSPQPTPCQGLGVCLVFDGVQVHGQCMMVYDG